MTDIEILHQMIKDAAKVQLSNHYNKMKVKLVEPDHPQSSTIIYGVPENTVIIKVDAFSSPDAVFKGSKGECKRADYVVVSNEGDKKVIVFIEMKTTKGDKNEVIRQLKGARCFIAYCQEIGRTFWEVSNFLVKYRQCFVSIGHTSIPKKKTRITRESRKHDQPEKMMRIDWPHHIQFNQLAGASG